MARLQHNILATARRSLARLERHVPGGRIMPAQVRTLIARGLTRLGIQIPAITDDHAAIWKARRDPEAVETYKRSLTSPYRQLLIDHLSRYEPLTSVVELGCHVGPNLKLLAERLPEASIIGVEINDEAVMEGRAWLAGMSNVAIRRNDFRDELRAMGKETVDCVVTCASLMLVDPDDIHEVLRLAWRAARKVVIVMEPHPLPGAPEARSRANGWRHDYSALMRSVGCEDVRVDQIPSDVGGVDLDAVTAAVKGPLRRTD